MIIRCVCRDSVLETRGVRVREDIARGGQGGKVVCVREIDPSACKFCKSF